MIERAYIQLSVSEQKVGRLKDLASYSWIDANEMCRFCTAVAITIVVISTIVPLQFHDQGILNQPAGQIALRGGVPFSGQLDPQTKAVLEVYQTISGTPIYRERERAGSRRLFVE